MPVYLSTYFICIKLIIVSCAPKLGDPLFDPLNFEAKNSYSVLLKPHKSDVNIPDDNLESNHTFENKNESIKKTKNILVSFYETSASDTKDIPVLRKKEDDEKEAKDRLHGSGYHFDETNCRAIGNRILCGYEKNKGDITPHDFIIDLKDDCRIRGDRIECGYFKIPSKVSLRQVLRIVKDMNYTIRTIKTEAPHYLPSTTPTTETGSEITNTTLTQFEGTSNNLTNLEKTTDLPIMNDKPATDENINTTSYTDVDDDDYLTPVPEEITSIKPCYTGTCGLWNKGESPVVQKPIEEEVTTVQHIDTIKTSTLIIPQEEKKVDTGPIGLSNLLTTLKPVTKCVEKNERIVCYVVPVTITTKALK